MAVPKRFVPVRVGMRFSRRVIGLMLVLMMRVMCMTMRMIQCFMHMLVAMTLAQMQPGANRHQRPRSGELHCGCLTEEQHGSHCANERRRSIVGSCARCTNEPQRNNEENQAEAIAYCP